ncbi:MAG TPA: Rieske 2Fe-2S domain-containing protein [Terriglobales bacterium]|jgi:Rieske Fe-S protein|nr:Rieske 2Fe-2S domain-containing protein [Terriglobales bacterium]
MMERREDTTAPTGNSGATGESPAPGRRRFVEVLLGGGLLATLVSFLYPVLRYLVPPASADLGSNTVVAAKVGDLKPNSGKVFRFGNQPGLLVLDSSGEYHAMSAVCTHLSCTVQYRADQRQVWCACHNGSYDLNGRNVSGPPPRPLQLYEVHVQGDEIVVNRQRSS